ncbi:MAG: RluA family pseudouridine synthase [Leptospiraceae bacterium]|nr:RluA family pseudouridine synthase [Leptospiraceae bacterium]
MQTKIEGLSSEIKITEYLTHRFTYQTEEEWENRILKGEIKLNSRILSQNILVSNDDIIEFIPENFIEPEVDFNFDIVFEDEYLLAVNKSGNLPVHPAGRYRKNTLITHLKDLSFDTLYLTHRIDRETSGLVLFAKDANSSSKIQSYFSKRTIYKEYLVLVHGKFPNELLAKGYQGQDENSEIRKKKKYSENEFSNSTSVETKFELLEYDSIKEISRISAKPKTGKIHQIRATLCSLGYPIVGDKIYGIQENIFLEFIKTGKVPDNFPKRQMLHSWKLEFEHPNNSKKLSLVAELKEDFMLDR